MFSDLIALLTRLVPTEQVNIFSRSYQLLYRLHGENLTSIVPQLIKDMSAIESQDAIGYIYNNTLHYLEEGLSRFGVFINDEIVEFSNVDELNDILNLFLEVESYEDVMSLINAIENSDHDIRLVSELTQMLNLTTKDYSEFILKISSNAINNLYGLLKTYALESVQSVTPYAKPNDLLKRFIELDYIDAVDPRIKMVLSEKPYTLNIDSILRSYGNLMADNPRGEYDWVFITLVCEEFEEFAEDLEALFGRWGRHFVEEQDLLQMAYKVKQVYRSLKGEEDE